MPKQTIFLKTTSLIIRDLFLFSVYQHFILPSQFYPSFKTWSSSNFCYTTGNQTRMYVRYMPYASISEFLDNMRDVFDRYSHSL